MMLGGEKKALAMVQNFIKTGNDDIKQRIWAWMGHLKWHEEWDWDICANKSVFPGSRKLTIYWENSEYELPEGVHEDIVWANNQKDYLSKIMKFIKMHNISNVTTRVPCLKRQIIGSRLRSNQPKLVTNKKKINVINEEDRRYMRLFGVPAPKKAETKL